MALPRGAFSGRLLHRLVAILAGAALIHVVEFHLGLGYAGGLDGRLSAATYAIQHCPLRPALAAILGLAGLSLGAAVWTMRLQLQRLADLQGSAPKRPTLRFSRPSAETICRRAILLAAGQYTIFRLALQIMPMRYLMQMHGAQMVMAMSPPVPAAILALLLGLLAALFLTVFEDRLQAVAEAILRLRALHAQIASERRPRPCSMRPALAAQMGRARFSRPPPDISSATV